MVVIVVALEDWTISVAMAPQKEPRSGVAAAFASTVRNAEPASALSPSVMTVMPRRNRPTPPRIEIAVDISIQARVSVTLAETMIRGERDDNDIYGYLQ